MSAERKAMRSDLVAALQTAMAAHVPLAGRKIVSAWSQDLDPASLPVVGVAVPLEEREPATMDTDQLEFRAVVVVKAKFAGASGTDGTEAEDWLDDAAEALVGPVEAALMTDGATDARGVALRSSAIEISGTGSPRVGTLTLTFGVTQLRARTRP